MPEALAILIVFVVSVAIYIAARIQTANSSAHVAVELRRLTHYRAWLEARRHKAGCESWDQTMHDRIAQEIQLTEAQLAKAMAATPMNVSEKRGA